jgi:hypothetical protein
LQALTAQVLEWGRRIDGIGGGVIRVQRIRVRVVAGMQRVLSGIGEEVVETRDNATPRARGIAQNVLNLPDKCEPKHHATNKQKWKTKYKKQNKTKNKQT